jgi:hypothetical protein
MQKEKNYSTAQVMRLEAAILQWNEPESLQDKFREMLGLPSLPADVQQQINAMNSRASKRNDAGRRQLWGVGRRVDKNKKETGTAQRHRHDREPWQ